MNRHVERACVWPRRIKKNQKRGSKLFSRSALVCTWACVELVHEATQLDLRLHCFIAKCRIVVHL